MNKEKLHYNSLLRRYMKNVRRLHSLRAANRNERRQNILAKHIERLLEKLQSLRLSLKRGVVASGIAIAATSMMPGSANAQSFGPIQTNPFGLTNVGGYGYSSPTLGDIDGDGDLDLISGVYEYEYDYNSGNYYYFGNFRYYENTGTNANPVFAASQTNPFGLAGIEQNETINPTFVDIDGDGDLDIMVNNQSGEFVFYENVGTLNAPAFAAPVTNPFSLLLNVVRGNSQPTFADLDNDGDLDLVIGSEFNNSGSNEILFYFENTGTVNAPVFAAPLENPFSLNPTGPFYEMNHAKLIDIDGDGDFDILVGTEYYDGDYNTPDGIFKYYENTGTASLPAFAAEVENPFGLTGPQRGFAFDVADIDNDGDLDIVAGEDGYYGNFFVWEGCTPTTSTINPTAICSYIAPSGAVYNTSGTFVDIIPNSTDCDSIITINLTVDPIAEQTFTDNAITICDNGPTTLQLSSSQNDVNYYLRNDLNDTIVDGPIAGNGSTVDFSTGNLTVNTTYNVYVEKLIPTKGLEFDDGNFSQKEVDCGSDPSVQISGTTITLEAWIYPTDWHNSLSSGNIINNEENSPDKGYMLRCGNNGQLGFTVGDGAWTDLLSPTGTLTLNTWQHVAATYDGTTMVLYVDGVEVASSNETVTIAQSSEPLIIGNYTGGGRPFLGSLDEVRIWSVGRSETEIVDNMNECLTGSETGLQAYYQFEDGTGSTTVSDQTANGNDGTLQNMDENTAWVNGSAVCSSCNLVLAETATVSISTPPTVSIPAGDEEICIGETVNITPSTGGTWMSSDAAVATITNAGEVNSLTAGTGDMTLTDGTTGCSNEPGTATITVNPDPTVTIPAGDEEICLGETVNITPSTGGTWVSSDATVATITNAGEVDGLSAGTADMTFTDGTTGCSNGSGTATITVNPALDVTVTNNTTSLTANAASATYQWLDCDDNNSVISGATSQTFTPTSNGNYAVEITENGCSDTSDCEVINTLGVDENAFGANINIYPNPTNGKVNVNLGKHASAVKMKLVSVQGQELLVQEVNDSSTTVDMSSYPQGVYILHLSSGDEQFFHRIIKN
jgi:hypothetical protein